MNYTYKKKKEEKIYHHTALFTGSFFPSHTTKAKN